MKTSNIFIITFIGFCFLGCKRQDGNLPSVNSSGNRATDSNPGDLAQRPQIQKNKPESEQVALPKTDKELHSLDPKMFKELLGNHELDTRWSGIALHELTRLRSLEAHSQIVSFAKKLERALPDSLPSVKEMEQIEATIETLPKNHWVYAFHRLLTSVRYLGESALPEGVRDAGEIIARLKQKYHDSELGVKLIEAIENEFKQGQENVKLNAAPWQNNKLILEIGDK
ncbi:MAG: hypothetical protein WCL71_05930 [Deltaproteobacteria bacterium]